MTDSYLPREHAADPLYRRRCRDRGADGIYREVLDAIRAGRAAGLAADVPDPLRLAFGAPSTACADTADTPPGQGWRRADGSYQEGAFREIGFDQVKAGCPRRDAAGALARDIDPAPWCNDWVRWRAHPAVVAVCGCVPGLDAGAWCRRVPDRRPLEPVADYRGRVAAPLARAAVAWRAQLAIGARQLDADYAATVARVDVRLRPASPGSQWGLVLRFAGFSAGPGGAAAAVAPWADRLAREPEPVRFALWCVLLGADYAAGRWRPTGRARRHAGNAAHTAVRTAQKLALAAAVAREERDASAETLTVALTTAQEDALCRAASMT